MQRKPTKNTRGANADEKRYHSWCKEAACAACGNLGPSIVHHCEGATFKHNKVLVGHWFVIPLCQVCDDVITRGSRKAFREQFGPQYKLWEDCVCYYSYELATPPPPEVFHAIRDWGK